MYYTLCSSSGGHYSNISQILPNLHLSSDIISEIQTEVAKGKEVTTHTSNVSVPGWTGAGYIVIDPKTGDGGYYISGGSNGGFASIGLYSGMFSLFSARNADLARLVSAGGVASLFSFIAQQMFILSFSAGAVSIVLDCNKSVLALIAMMALHIAIYIVLALTLFITVTTPLGIMALFAGSATLSIGAIVIEGLLQDLICK